MTKPETDMAKHKFADPKKLQTKTNPPEIKMGVDPKAFAAFWPRPDLNGLRVKMPNRPEIYLVDNGYKRWIPNSTTYNNLFRDWSGIVVDINVNDIWTGAPITDGAVLAKPDTAWIIYLIDNGVKRWITDPSIMDTYNFSWDRIVVVPHVLLDFLQTGSSIQ